MSQSALLKKIISKKIQNKYIFILYKQQYKNTSSEATPLQVCYNNYETSRLILQYYINELYKTRTIISPCLLKLLNSKKSIQTKINAIILEYNNLFGPYDSSEDYYSINEFKFKLINPNSMIYHKIIRKQLKHNRYNIKFTLRDYNSFYKYIQYKNNYRLTQN